MFLGHFGAALAFKRLEPKLSLGTLFLAVQLPDILWGAFLLRGWEEVRIDPGYTALTPLQFIHYPISWRPSITRGPPEIPAGTGRLQRW